MGKFEVALLNAQDVVLNVMDAQVIYGPARLTDATTYALDGGKCFRAFLVLEGARLFNQDASHAAAAIECIHAYSLIHDDLPCMDDDDLRRGKLTVHRKWDEATAVLAGDALQSIAFLLIAGAGYDAETKTELLEGLAQAAGQMVAGQMQDILAETSEIQLTLEQVRELQSMKTGALIHWSAIAGPMLAGQDTKPMSVYGHALGEAFQIADDILDVEGDAATVGKAVGKDSDAGKATFVSLLGLDGAKRRATELVETACDALNPYGEDADTLREAAQFVISRNK